tara:strand:+ start:5039 stop:5971 length:933 start_codon:yes stop_codon:yes gene_type:complete
MRSDNNLLETYVKTLVDKADLKNIPSKKDVDLVFDGGAFNGAIEQGIAMYIKELEHANKMNVCRVSGCSVGAFIALIYITNKNLDVEQMFVGISEHFKSTLNLQEYTECAKKLVYEHITDEDLNMLNGILHIVYYDMDISKQVVENQFKTKEHLYNCLLRTSHIPFVSNTEMKCEGRYIDGLAPHIFRDGQREVLFISTLTRHKISRAFVSHTEVNCSSRLLCGVADADEFFTRGSSEMCSWTRDWWFHDYIWLRFRELFFFLVIWIINVILHLKHSAPEFLTDSLISHGIQKGVIGLFTDFAYHILKTY